MMAPHNVLARLFPSKIPTSKPPMRNPMQSTDFFRTTTEKPVDVHSSLSWTQGQLVGQRVNDGFMGPINKKEELATTGLGSTIDYSNTEKVISQAETKSEVRNTLPVGSRRGTVKKKRGVSVF